MRDLVIALADLHGRDLLADDFVEHGGLAQRAGDDRDLVLVEIGDVLEHRVDRRVIGLGRNDAEISERIGCPIEILHRSLDDDGFHDWLLSGAATRP